MSRGGGSIMGGWPKQSVGFCTEIVVLGSTISIRTHCLEMEYEEGCMDTGKWEGWIQRMESWELPREVEGACHVEHKAAARSFCYSLAWKSWGAGQTLKKKITCSPPVGQPSHGNQIWL